MWSNISFNNLISLFKRDPGAGLVRGRLPGYSGDLCRLFPRPVIRRRCRDPLYSGLSSPGLKSELVSSLWQYASRSVGTTSHCFSSIIMSPLYFHTLPSPLLTFVFLARKWENNREVYVFPSDSWSYFIVSYYRSCAQHCRDRPRVVLIFN